MKPAPERDQAALELDEIVPMVATENGRPFTDPAWLYEIKFDGYRTLARFGGGQPVRLRTKNGADSTKWFPEVVTALGAIARGPHIVDGEVCVLDDQGRSDFNRLQDRARRRRLYAGADPVTMLVFDLLMENGRSIVSLPLVQRKQRLARLFAHALKGPVLVLGELPADATLFEQFVVPLALEGFVAKRKASTYQQGPERSPDWLKIKRPGAVPPERFRR